MRLVGIVRIFAAWFTVLSLSFGATGCALQEAPSVAPGLPSFTARRLAPERAGAGWERLANGVRGLVPVDMPRLVGIIRHGDVDEVILPRIPALEHPEVDYHLNYFTETRRTFIDEALRRRELYRAMIRESLAKYGLPEELENLAFLESRFIADARSPMGGTIGLWQFTRGTGLSYGLRIDRGIDERTDPKKATDAAARYLLDLFNDFGDWYVVAAAYNCGQYKVRNAIAAAGTDDVFALAAQGLISENTKNYVARFAALSMVMSDPLSYGFAEVEPDARVIERSIGEQDPPESPVMVAPVLMASADTAPPRAMLQRPREARPVARPREQLAERRETRSKARRYVRRVSERSPRISSRAILKKIAAAGVRG